MFNEEIPQSMAATAEVVGHGMEDPAQRLAALDEVLAPDARIHVAGSPTPLGREEYKRFLAEFYEAFPGLTITREDQFTAGDKVVARWTLRGQHRGDFRDLPATGKPVTMTGMAIWRLAAGKTVEEWVEWDALGLMQQLGAIPAPGQAS